MSVNLEKLLFQEYMDTQKKINLMLMQKVTTLETKVKDLEEKQT